MLLNPDQHIVYLVKKLRKGFADGIQIIRNNRSFAASDDLDAVSESLSELLDRIDDMLIWIEQRGSNTELVYCPKNTREIVSRLYFNGDERTILTSATLTNATSGSLEEQYSYFISNTGFPVGERGCLSEPKARLRHMTSILKVTRWQERDRHILFRLRKMIKG